MDDIEKDLSSDHATACPCPNCLICDEDFQNNAREFVRNNACTKGEPNLTIHMFTEWLKAE